MSVDGWADQLYGPVSDYKARGDGFSLWKRHSTAVNIVRAMAEDRERQIAFMDVRPRRGEHVGIVIYFPADGWHTACAGFDCTFLGASRRSYDAAEADGQEHERHASLRPQQPRWPSAGTCHAR